MSLSGNTDYDNAEDVLNDLRAFINGARMAADDSVIFTRGEVLYIGAFALHGGPWSPLDLKANNWRNDWTIGGRKMDSGEFGNYIAGYYAGYSDTPGIYEGMRAGGVIWAIMGRQEKWDDSESVSDINDGYEAGRRDFEAGLE